MTTAFIVIGGEEEDHMEVWVCALLWGVRRCATVEASTIEGNERKGNRRVGSMRETKQRDTNTPR